ncbi:uncharacterized protein LOC101461277 isoform X1 [Ceratitis capitata]|uniref:DUF4806 domain-containing protein n=1 Tax=Ceratitis capitata TaxID=7213 RepID=W8C840_CERCA|nr:uncharacterized protein LOC101461277 isoform X1 [Ceratitis capitata]
MEQSNIYTNDQLNTEMDEMDELSAQENDNFGVQLNEPKAVKVIKIQPSGIPSLLKQILNNQKQIMSNQEKMNVRLQNLEKATKESARERANLMVQNQSIHECKVLTKKIFSSIRRITGELENEIHSKISETLPLTCLDAVEEVEEKLNNKEYLSTMKAHLFQIKGATGTIEDVFRRVMSDDLIDLFNWDGRAEKRALNSLKLISDVLYDVFFIEGRYNYEMKLKKAIKMSHKRSKQKAYLKRMHND